jgi:hypothetical protein
MLVHLPIGREQSLVHSAAVAVVCDLWVECSHHDLEVAELYLLPLVCTMYVSCDGIALCLIFVRIFVPVL